MADGRLGRVVDKALLVKTLETIPKGLPEPVRPVAGIVLRPTSAHADARLPRHSDLRQDAASAGELGES